MLSRIRRNEAGCTGAKQANFIAFRTVTVTCCSHDFLVSVRDYTCIVTINNTCNVTRQEFVLPLLKKTEIAKQNMMTAAVYVMKKTISRV